MSNRLQWETVIFLDDGEVVFIEIISTEGHVEGKDCWCGPELIMDCDECEPRLVIDGKDSGQVCWKCGDRGFVEYDRWSGEVPIAIHQDDRLD